MLLRKRPHGVLRSVFRACTLHPIRAELNGGSGIAETMAEHAPAELVPCLDDDEVDDAMVVEDTGGGYPGHATTQYEHLGAFI